MHPTPQDERLFAMAISTRALWVQLTSQMWAGRLA